MDSIRLQATIGGFAAGGSVGAVTVFGEVDVVSGVLLIDAWAPVRPGDVEVRREGCAAVTNNAGTDDADMVFTEDELRDAIVDYFDTVSRGLLVLDQGIAGMNPESKIEPDGLDERGRKYRIANDMTNGQVAVLVLCWFAQRQSAMLTQIAAFDDYADLSVTTVGIPASPRSATGKRIAGYAMAGKLPLGADGWPV